jgi:hypothetical protein
VSWGGTLFPFPREHYAVFFSTAHSDMKITLIPLVISDRPYVKQSLITNHVRGNVDSTFVNLPIIDSFIFLSLYPRLSSSIS